MKSHILKLSARLAATVSGLNKGHNESRFPRGE